jgi:hypothetical protein
VFHQDIALALANEGLTKEPHNKDFLDAKAKALKNIPIKKLTKITTLSE